MKYFKNMIAVSLALLVLSSASFAGDRVPSPVIPKATSKAKNGGPEGCVEPVSDMRRNHMKYILHQRDETMHKGIRTSRHSFKRCINCHVVKDKKTGKPVNHKDKRHFCNSCHNYAAVKIDCFDCHASTPKPGPAATSSKLNSSNKLVKKVEDQ